MGDPADVAFAAVAGQRLGNLGIAKPGGIAITPGLAIPRLPRRWPATAAKATSAGSPMSVTTRVVTLMGDPADVAFAAVAGQRLGNLGIAKPGVIAIPPGLAIPRLPRRWPATAAKATSAGSPMSVTTPPGSSWRRAAWR